ncbi:hypothetical protein B0T17DRAFT_311717 [Bombardia bombarda]|uniref:Uncharacterized protein n=1 Tax=Bombardia bombarda TaxID=252184 RepID=A0AA39WLY2_9PEZI|nr:hypothetical protein B0T17DRAFT_311717 [Bombardia bombarda]
MPEPAPKPGWEGTMALGEQLKRSPALRRPKRNARVSPAADVNRDHGSEDNIASRTRAQVRARLLQEGSGHGLDGAAVVVDATSLAARDDHACRPAEPGRLALSSNRPKRPPRHHRHKILNSRRQAETTGIYDDHFAEFADNGAHGHSLVPSLGSQLIFRPSFSYDSLNGAVLGSSSSGNLPVSMKSPRWSFLHFPGELRNMIYEYSLHYPTSLELYSAYNHRIVEYYAQKSSDLTLQFPQYSGILKTPTILLLCRAITAECLSMLRAQQFVIDRFPPWVPGQIRPLRISQFIGRQTLQSLRDIEIRIPLGHGSYGSGWVWDDILKELLAIWRQRNAFKCLRVLTVIHNRAHIPIWTSHEHEHLESIENALDEFKFANPNSLRPDVIKQEYWVSLSFAKPARIDDKNPYPFISL